MSSSSHAMPAVGTPFIILGADAVLAALPASPVQLAHACQALGFQLAAPATWGDELIAERCLEQLAGYEHPSAVMCSCPLVTQRLTRSSTSLEPFMLTFTSPPVATARYLRSAFSGQALHITYAGSCPGADDESIDARLRPSDLLDAFAEHDIVVGAQPNCFEALVPLDRRRFYSLPGGAPTRDHIERVAGRELIELTGDDVVLELTQHLIDQIPAVIDLAPSLGCACAGAGEHAMRGNARAGLLTLEPPRARQSVLDSSVEVDVSQTLIEACAHASSEPEEEPAELEVHLAADSAPVHESVLEIGDAPAMRETMLFEAIADDDVELVDVVDVMEVVDVVDVVDVVIEEHPAAPSSRRRPVSVRAAASLPRYASESGESVPRASLAVLRRALARIATRKARRQPKVERGRRDRSMELRDGLVRTPVRTPRSLAIPSPELPRPVPPPPARRRPRTMLEM
ncbi:MAG TPA: hypothetical protein VGO46_15365 [Gemmatimonadaceae bacterium]|nr:hypothetical protein [Gemmatimonadaceae bacterium]